MPKIIDHTQRKIAILRQAFSLFAQRGYQNTSLSHLAVACGISRPSLYLYFRDKEEIFTYAVKYYTDEMFSDYRELASRSGPVLPQIRRIIADIIFKSWHSRDFITSLGDYLLQKRQEERNFPEAIRRRTVKLDHLLCRMLREGMKTGEIRKIPIEATSMQILDLIQAYLFKLAIISAADPRQTISVIEVFLEGLARLDAPED
ncbi:MAG: TetR/AcrR family transcriptional regulator [Spirochaetaceae bacterium]|nr:TetR/AcrR family transcriptional regulator [Spirochaetaceae bacterium]